MAVHCDIAQIHEQLTNHAAKVTGGKYILQQDNAWVITLHVKPKNYVISQLARSLDAGN